MGLSMVLVLVLTRTLLTSHVDPGRVLTIRPRSQVFLGVFSSTMTTRSPGVKFLLIVFQLGRSCIKGRYSWSSASKTGQQGIAPASWLKSLQLIASNVEGVWRACDLSDQLDDVCGLVSTWKYENV